MSEPTEQDLIRILDNVNFIKKKYDNIAKITGENFNIFSVFKKVYHENYHSALISELLNEEGLHEQGNLYLNLFINILNERISVEKLAINEIINFKNSTSVTEKVTYNYDRIDIYIEDDNQIIIIENKIGAIDQDLQLKRYFDFIKNKGKSFCIIYLWKDYIDVTKYNEDITNSTFGEGTEVREKTISISYKNEIKTWIKGCIKLSANLPLVRETLIQYLNTINIITNQSTNNRMSMDILKVILSNNNIDAAFQIKDALNNLPVKLASDLIIELSNNNVQPPFNKRYLAYNGTVIVFDDWLYNKFQFCLTIESIKNEYALRIFDRNELPITDEVISLVKKHGFILDDRECKKRFNVFSDEEKMVQTLKTMFNEFSNLQRLK